MSNYNCDWVRSVTEYLSWNIISKYQKHKKRLNYHAIMYKIDKANHQNKGIVDISTPEAYKNTDPQIQFISNSPNSIPMRPHLTPLFSIFVGLKLLFKRYDELCSNKLARG